MDQTWTILTIIGATCVAVGTVLGVYFTHKHKIEERLKEIENKVSHHEKFIDILEKKALAAIKKEFEDPEKEK